MAWKYLGAAALAGGIFYGIASVESADAQQDLGLQEFSQADLGHEDLSQQPLAAKVSVSQPTPVVSAQDVGASQPAQPAAATSPSDTSPAIVAVTITDLDQLKDRYRDLTKEEITQEISDLEANLRDADMIARANAQQLSATEMQDLSDILQNLDALRLVKLERKLDAITARIKNRPVISTDELP